MRTRFFQSSRAVFQGGGVKGISFVGAYKVARDRGVNFSEIAGASAGSITASLIGAGADPDFLLEKLENINFSSFLISPNSNLKKTNLLKRKIIEYLCKFVFKNVSLHRIFISGGAYSSENIEKWIDSLLHELLPDVTGQIKFKHLQLPTSIVATDITNKGIKIWSTKLTPEAPVSFAVRCSCSIPILFEPVSDGDTKYVDGGLVSNLPAFIFYNENGMHRGDRVLAFRLQDKSTPPVEWSIKNIFDNCIDTIVDGGMKLQLSMLPGVHEILIEISDIKATDFEKINNHTIKQLIEYGEVASKKFFDNEASKVKPTRENIGKRVCWHEGDTFDTLVERTNINVKKAYVSMDGTRWFWTCFPTILKWRMSGADLFVICAKSIINNKEKLREQQRRYFLQKLGASIIEVDNLPYNGFIVIGQAKENSFALSYLDKDTSGAPHCIIYNGIYDNQYICDVEAKLDSSNQFQKNGNGNVDLIEAEPDELITLLKNGVRQYENPSVEITLQEIDINKLFMLNKYVRSHKYKQSEGLIALYKKYSIQIFKPVNIIFNNEIVSTITPPVIEQTGEYFVVIEGNSRIYYCWKNGIKKIYTLVVNGVASPLPGIKRNPNQTIVDIMAHRMHDRIEGFSYEDFRHIERSARPY